VTVCGYTLFTLGIPILQRQTGKSSNTLYKELWEFIPEAEKYRFYRAAEEQVVPNSRDLLLDKISRMKNNHLPIFVILEDYNFILPLVFGALDGGYHTNFVKLGLNVEFVHIIKTARTAKGVCLKPLDKKPDVELRCNIDVSKKSTVELLRKSIGMELKRISCNNSLK
jgi:hypothetical protein